MGTRSRYRHLFILHGVGCGAGLAAAIALHDWGKLVWVLVAAAWAVIAYLCDLRAREAEENERKTQQWIAKMLEEDLYSTSGSLVSRRAWPLHTHN